MRWGVGVIKESELKLLKRGRVGKAETVHGGGGLEGVTTPAS